MARTSCLMKSVWFFITQRLFSVSQCLCGEFVFSISRLLIDACLIARQRRFDLVFPSAGDQDAVFVETAAGFVAA